MSDLKEFAENAVAQSAQIPDFAYFGDLPIGETWAFTFSRHRDSGILDVSNFETIREDVEDRFADDCEVVHCSHWAVGWIDHLAVRMLDGSGTPTEAAGLLQEWQRHLEDYPVASDEDYSQREHDDQQEQWGDWVCGDFIRAISIDEDGEDCDLVWANPNTDHPKQSHLFATYELPKPKTEDGALFELFCSACDTANVYWEHESDGQTIDVDRVAESVTEEDLARYGFSLTAE